MKNRTDVGLLMIRLIIAGPMLLYGIGKILHGVDFIKEMLADVGMPAFIANGVYAGEIIAPILIIIGFRTKLAGLVFAFNCLTIILLSQTQNILTLNEFGGWAIELLAIYMVVTGALFFTGAGKYAVSIKSKWD